MMIKNRRIDVYQAGKYSYSTNIFPTLKEAMKDAKEFLDAEDGIITAKFGEPK